jgi:hypothetical protein
MTDDDARVAIPYALDESCTPPALLHHGKQVFHFQRAAMGSFSHYEVREMARLIVAVLNKSYREDT